MIVVAGEALVDLIARPDGSIAASLGGGPFNAARAVARLDLPVAWIGGLSSDRFGRQLESALIRDGVGLDLVQRTDAPTTLALAELDLSGAASYRFYVDGTSAPGVLPRGLAGGLPAGTRALHVGTLGLVLEPMAATLEGLVASLPDDVLLFVDPNARPSVTRDPDAYRARISRVLARADIVKVSADDLAFLRPGDDAVAAARWVASLGPSAVVVTDGRDAVRLLAGGVLTEVSVPPARVVDTIGAGDIFGAALLGCLVHVRATRATLDGDAVLHATAFAVRAAAIACEREGADPPTLAELGGWPR